MRIATWNVNGLRAAFKKGFWTHVQAVNPDVLMLQEIRVLPDQLTEVERAPDGWNVVWHPAEKKGYAGTATLSRAPIELLGIGMDGEDDQGRVVQTRVQGVRCINVYLPSGSRSEEAQANKEVFMDRFFEWTQAFAQSDEPVILGGDLNIAHTENDIHNPVSNKKTSGFLPHEREWFTRWLATGWTDLFRAQVGLQKGPYSWWSNRGQARALDRGWRIDYLVGNAAAAARCTGASIHKPGGMEVSDHAPVVIDLL
jgi:exodeoxyribonuclease III